MKGKVCLVTGANVGLGKQVCMELAAQGAEVVMSARNRLQAEQVRDQIISETGNKQIKLMLADLSSFQEVVNLSNTIKAEYHKLDVLINNAGIFLTAYQETADGIETQWMVNHLAPYLLTRRLLDLLQSAPEARIINVSSKAHLKGSMDFDNLNGRGRYNGLAAYSQSKLANIMFTKELAQRLMGTQISSFALHPGVVNTHIGNKNSSGWMSWAWKLGKPFMVSPAKGAKTIVYLATEPQLGGLSGLYFVNCQPHPSSAISTDRVLSTKLWDISEAQTQAYLTA